MLKLLSRLFRHRDSATKVVPLAVRGKYDAAQTTEDNRRHWAMADGLSAAAANSRSVRRTLRNRARYEVANNSYAKGIISTLANDVVGRGPILQVATGDDSANTRIERAFTPTGAVGTWQYAAVYNLTATNKELICWADYGVPIALSGSSDPFTFQFDQVNGVLWGS